MNKKIIIPAATLAIVGALYSTGLVNAQESLRGRSALVERIAQRFNLDRTEVQTVFDEARDEHQQERVQEYEDMLTEAVSNGELTAEQKDLLLAKHEEMRANMSENGQKFSQLSQEERETQRQELSSKHEELQAWAEENGIDMQYLRMGEGEGRPGDQGGPRQGGQDGLKRGIEE